MRRVWLRSALVCLVACGPVGTEAPHEPRTPQVGVTEPEAEPEPVAVAEPEPEIEPVEEPEPEPEPEAEPEPLDKMWAAEDEPRILAVQPLVAAAAAEHGVDPHLVNGVIWVESKFRRKAKNRSGARGLMQLMPGTAKAIGRKLGRPARVYDAEFNVHAGTWYLSRMLAKFDGDETLALSAYVRGPAKIRAWIEEGREFPDGVKGFVDKVQHARRVFASLGWPQVQPPEPSAVGVGSDLEEPAVEAAAPEPMAAASPDARP